MVLNTFFFFFAYLAISSCREFSCNFHVEGNNVFLWLNTHQFDESRTVDLHFFSFCWIHAYELIFGSFELLFCWPGWHGNWLLLLLLDNFYTFSVSCILHWLILSKLYSIPQNSTSYIFYSWNISPNKLSHFYH